ncbi:MAG: NAD(P)-binding domain-containing protein, partial [Myxococcota bacterium]|nr:NAD(P)-binding domain-containing protein [Myxococcota bacterium]
MIVGIIGGGAWGRALATLAAEAGNRPRIGYRNRPPRGFPGTPNLEALAQETDLLILAVPPEGVGGVVAQARLQPGHHVLVAARGLEPDTGQWLSRVVTEGSPCRRVGALAGPALAAEVVARRPSAMVVASAFDEVAALAQQALHSSICRVYTSPDLLGVELAGAMVSVLSVAVGLADGLRLGVGVQGVIVTRGLAEARRLGRALGADDATFAGLAGVGELVACGNHPEHPGYVVGQALARAEHDAHARRITSEAGALLTLARRSGVEL